MPEACLIESRELGPEVRHFTFEVPEVQELSFKPGMFVSFTEELKGKKVTRAYSICSPPAGNRFELCLNRVKDGHFSPHLFEMKPGDRVAMKGPLGNFGWREPVRECVLVATGTGIAPFRGMLADSFARGMDARVTLIFGARYEHGLLFAGEFQEMAARHANFRFLPTITRPENGWTGRVGRVQPLMLEEIGERRELEVYLCGLKEMVEESRTLLKERGFDRKQIIAEKYD